MQFRFAEFVLDTGPMVLTRGGEEVALRAKAMRLLLLFLENPGQLLTKDMIVDAIWHGRHVSDDALYSQVYALRKALDDRHKPFRFIETAHAQGFRFIGKVARSSPAKVPPPEPAPPEPQSDPRGAAPRIAVLPFRNAGSGTSAPALSHALPDELVDALSRTRAFQVVARQSSFRISPEADPLLEAREKLAARYCLSGTIEEHAGEVAISIELADTEARDVVWSQRYTVGIEEIYDVRSDIVAQVVAAIDAAIPAREAERVRMLDPASLTAWQSYHVGMANLFAGQAANYPLARDHLSRAVTLDNRFARALAGLSQLYWWQLMNQHSVSEATREMMVEKAGEAIAADPMDPFANLVRGRCVWLDASDEEGMPWFERALDLNPSYAIAHGTYGNFLAMGGHAEKAIEHVERAIELSPYDPVLDHMYGVRSAAEMLLGNTDAAVEWSRKALEQSSTSLLPLQGALIAFHHAGHGDEAAKIAERIRTLRETANFRTTTGIIPMRSPEFLALTREAFGHHGLG